MRFAGWAGLIFAGRAELCRSRMQSGFGKEGTMLKVEGSTIMLPAGDTALLRIDIGGCQ